MKAAACPINQCKRARAMRTKHEPAAGGHDYGKDNKERAAFTALGYAFLKNKIGWPDRPA
jgi:prolyl oligopeptidase PreP (S9A serine peptidase family)